jgi:thiol-disulfide isomerase/thioredoxin
MLATIKVSKIIEKYVTSSEASIDVYNICKFKIMKTSYLNLIILLLCSSIILGQSQDNQNKKPIVYNKTVHLELIDNKYECLSMIAINYKSKNIEYKGKSNDGRNWVFYIPDSAFNKALGVAFRNFSISNKEAVKMINLCYIQQNDTFMSPNFINFNNTQNIKLKIKYVRRDSIESYHRDSTGSVKRTKYIHDFYTIKKPDNENILSICESGTFCCFNTNRNAGETYKEFLSEYVKLIKQYPDSKTLLSMLLSQFDGGRFKYKEDIQLLYNSFSNKNKNSYIGQILSKNLSLVSTTKKFNNIKLQNSITHKLEPIILDTTKFSLIVFSASWCIPCHKLIPLLKEIDNDLHKNLNLIYISIDEQSTMEQWKILLQKENITWRSLSTHNNIDFIKNIFLVYSIPRCFLVCPNGTMEVLDIRDSNDKEKIYKKLRLKND